MRYVALISGFITALVLSVWLHFSAPCGTFKYSPVKEIPARCLSEYTK